MPHSRVPAAARGALRIGVAHERAVAAHAAARSRLAGGDGGRQGLRTGRRCRTHGRACRGTAHYALKVVALTHADDAASAVALEDEWQRRHLLRGSRTSSTRLRDLTCHAPVSAAGLHAGRGATAQGRACSHFRALRERIPVRRLSAYLWPRRLDATWGKGGPHSGYRHLADKDEVGGSSPPRPTSGSDQQECWSSHTEPGGRGVCRIKNSYLVTTPRHGPDVEALIAGHRSWSTRLQRRSRASSCGAY
jgi:hypothetical protein